MYIDLIPLKDIEIWLRSNGIEPTDSKSSYDIAWDLIQSNSTVPMPESIADWILAYNISEKGTIINTYTLSSIRNANSENLQDLANELGLDVVDKSRIIRILTYLEKLINDLVLGWYKDIDYNILLDLDDIELINLCATNTRIGKFCSDDEFWRKKIEKKYPGVPIPLQYQGDKKAFYVIIRNLSLRGLKMWAVMNDYLDILKYVYEIDKTLINSYTATDVAILGYLDILKWLHELDNKMIDQIIANVAAASGKIDVLKWLSELG